MIQEQLIDKHLHFWVIDADRIAAEVGMGSINTIMQPCFFALANVLPPDEAVARIKESVQKTYGKRGPVSSRGTPQPSTARCRSSPGHGAASVTCEGPSGVSGPTTRPTSCGASPSRCWPVRATCCPSALFRPTGPS